MSKKEFKAETGKYGEIILSYFEEGKEDEADVFIVHEDDTWDVQSALLDADSRPSKPALDLSEEEYDKDPPAAWRLHQDTGRAVVVRDASGKQRLILGISRPIDERPEGEGRDECGIQRRAKLSP